MQHPAAPSLFRNRYRVRSYEVDGGGRLRPVTLLNYLQDSAGNHAAELGFSVSQLRRRQVTWVISRYHVRFFRHPRRGEELEVRTWPSARQSLFALRDFEVCDLFGVPAVAATSSWALIDLERRRPVRLADHLSRYPLIERRALEDDFPTLPVPAQVDLELPFRVRYGDLDVNGHVNNTVYADWAMETVPAEIARNWLVESLEIGFRAEAFYGDRVLVRTQALDVGEKAVFVHQLVSDRDGRELTRLRTSWRPAPDREEAS
jgi:acyl-ACP thioesterase